MAQRIYRGISYAEMTRRDHELPEHWRIFTMAQRPRTGARIYDVYYFPTRAAALAACEILRGEGRLVNSPTGTWRRG